MTAASAPKRKLGLVSTVALAVGTIVGGGVFALSGIILNDAGPLAIVAYILAAVTVVLSALCFAAVSSRAQEGQTGYGPLAEVLGPRWRFLTMWSFYVSAIAGAAFMLVAFGSYLQYFLTGADPLVLALVAAVVLIALNLGPADLVGRAEVVLVVFKLAVLFLLIGFGLAAFDPRYLEPFDPHGLGAVLPATGLLFSAYLGFSVVTNVAGVVENPRRNVPMAILISLLIVAVVYIGITLAMLMSGLHTFGAAGVADAAKILIGPVGGALIALAAVVSTLSGTNAVFLGNSQLMVRMAANGDIPGFFGRVGKHTHAYVAVLLGGAIAIVLMLSGGIDTIATYSSVAGIVGLVIMDLAAFQMARRHWPEPGIDLPLGVLIPVVAAIFALLQLPSLGFVNVVIGLLLVGVGLVIYAVRGRSGAPRADQSGAASHGGAGREVQAG